MRYALLLLALCLLAGCGTVKLEPSRVDVYHHHEIVFPHGFTAPPRVTTDSGVR